MSLEVRVARIESDVAHLKVDVSDVKTATQHAELKAEFAAFRNEIKGEFSALRQEFKALIRDSQTKMILWNVGTMIALTGLVFSIARFIH